MKNKRKEILNKPEKQRKSEEKNKIKISEAAHEKTHKDN
jgi:hypothetical protein